MHVYFVAPRKREVKALANGSLFKLRRRGCIIKSGSSKQSPHPRADGTTSPQAFVLHAQTSIPLQQTATLHEGSKNAPSASTAPSPPPNSSLMPATAPRSRRGTCIIRSFPHNNSKTTSCSVLPTTLSIETHCLLSQIAVPTRPIPTALPTRNTSGKTALHMIRSGQTDEGGYLAAAPISSRARDIGLPSSNTYTHREMNGDNGEGG